MIEGEWGHEDQHEQSSTPSRKRDLNTPPPRKIFIVQFDQNSVSPMLSRSEKIVKQESDNSETNPWRVRFSG